MLHFQILSRVILNVIKPSSQLECQDKMQKTLINHYGRIEVGTYIFLKLINFFVFENALYSDSMRSSLNETALERYVEKSTSRLAHWATTYMCKVLLAILCNLHNLITIHDQCR